MMPVFVKDWIAATVHMTDAERGAYFSLLAHQWVNKVLPTDEAQLARIMGTPEKEFESRWSTVGSKFDGDQEGLFNNRLEQHRKNSIRLRDAKVRGADAANVVRRAKRTQRMARFTDALRNASATPTSTSSSKNSEEEKKDSNGRSAYAERLVNHGTNIPMLDMRSPAPAVSEPGAHETGELLREMSGVQSAHLSSASQRAASGAASQEPGALVHEDAGAAREADPGALREMRSDESGAASSGLHEPMDGEMALSGVPPAGAPHKYRSQKRIEALEQRFVEFKLAYPMRGGGQSWTTALKLWLKLCAKGYTPEQIIEGAERYARYCRTPRPGKPTGIERTEWVMHAKTFLGPDAYFLQEWDVAADIAQEEIWSPPVDDPPEAA
jgi:uncharacterized protein YdaU (DUF1376 family)